MWWFGFIYSVLLVWEDSTYSIRCLLMLMYHTSSRVQDFLVLHYVWMECWFLALILILCLSWQASRCQQVALSSVSLLYLDFQLTPSFWVYLSNLKHVRTEFVPSEKIRVFHITFFLINASFIFFTIPMEWRIVTTFASAFQTIAIVSCPGVPFLDLVDFTIVWAMALRPLLSHLLEQSCARQRSLVTLIQLQGTENSY